MFCRGICQSVDSVGDFFICPCNGSLSLFVSWHLLILLVLSLLFTACICHFTDPSYWIGFTMKQRSTFLNSCNNNDFSDPSFLSRRHSCAPGHDSWDCWSLGWLYCGKSCKLGEELTRSCSELGIWATGVKRVWSCWMERSWLGWCWAGACFQSEMGSDSNICGATDVDQSKEFQYTWDKSLNITNELAKNWWEASSKYSACNAEIYESVDEQVDWLWNNPDTHRQRQGARKVQKGLL